MNREQAINYLISSGFTHEQVGEVVRALTYEPTTKNDPKFCPDRKAKTTNMETILHCIENECAAYKDGKCLKYNSDQEPTTKNDLGVDCISRKAAEDITWQDPSYTDPLNILTEVRDKIRELPSVTPQLSVSEVTALAEWTEKLTKASEDAYNKGYEAGRKEQEPITSKDKFIYALTACGCLLKDGKTWYEHNELIECFENLGLLENPHAKNKESMTKEEAKEFIAQSVKSDVDMAKVADALKALEQEPILDRVRAEIEQTRKMYLDMNDIDWLNGCDYVLSVIDKYDAESEVKDGKNND